jgi:hypothetical protein
MEWWEASRDWVLDLGEKYSVNPYIFAGLYFGAIPFFILSLRWTIKSIRRKKPVVLPLILTAVTFKAAYIYVLISGKNIPWWVYMLISFVIGYGAITTYNKIKNKTRGKS